MPKNKLTPKQKTMLKKRLMNVFKSPSVAVAVKTPKRSVISIQRGGVRTTIIRTKVKKRRKMGLRMYR